MLRKWEIEIIQDEIGAAVMVEHDADGDYVYVIDTKEIVFQTDENITLHIAFCNWCDSREIIPF